MSQQEAARLLAKIAQDLSSPDIVFPTSFELTLQVQSLLKRPDVSVEKIVQLIAAEPLMSTKILAYANSVALRGSGQAATDVKSAILRVGFDAVRTVSFSLSVEQIIRSKDMQPFHDLSSAIWEHSLCVATVGRILARKYRMNAEKAFFLGMIHDLGAFYLLFRFSRESELAADPHALTELIFQWHDGIGHALLSAMDQPEELLVAVQDHEAPTTIEVAPSNWTELLSVADTLGQELGDWVPAELRLQNPRHISDNLLDPATRDEILEQAKEELASLRSALF
jgi:HD-like signal output (HDOD) protein